VHSVTVDVVGSGQKLPAGHGLQLVLAVRLQTLSTYWPSAHTPHSVHAGALIPDEYDTPSWHSAHVTFCSDVQAEVTYDPVEQVEQATDAVEPGRQKLFAWHAIWVDALGQ
jgi:hypothetical protein